MSERDPDFDLNPRKKTDDESFELHPREVDFDLNPRKIPEPKHNFRTQEHPTFPPLQPQQIDESLESQEQDFDLSPKRSDADDNMPELNPKKVE